ncbi:hypothetical protein [Actinomadura verrucosospora]
MLFGAIGGIATAIFMVFLPYDEGMVAVFPPQSAALASPGLLISLLLSGSAMPRLTFATCLPAMISAVVGAVGALFSGHAGYSLVWVLWAVIFFFGQQRAFLKVHKASA